MQQKLMVNEAKKWLEARLPSSVSFIEQLANINSGTDNPDGVNKVQAELADRLVQLGLAVDMYPQSDRGNILLARTKASLDVGGDVALIGHADTFFEPQSQFPVIIEGDTIKGPGVYDMKGGVVSMIDALTALSQMGFLEKLPLRLLINSAEEKPTFQVLKTMQELLQGSDAALVFEFGRKGDHVVVERKGIATYLCHVKGRAAHAGNRFFEGANAIVEISRIAQALYNLSDQDRDVTCNPGKIWGGQKANGVPDEAHLLFEARFPRIADYEGITDVLQTLTIPSIPGTTAEFEITEIVPPMEITSATQALFREWQKAGLKAGLEYQQLPRVGGVSDGNLAAGLGIPTLDSLGPRGGKEHTDGEYLEISSLIPKTLNLIHFLHERSKAVES